MDRRITSLFNNNVSQRMESFSWRRIISYFLQTKDGKDHWVSDSMWDYDNYQLIIFNWEDKKCGLLCIGIDLFLVHSCQNACITILPCRLNISGSIYSLHLKYNRFLAILSQTMLNLIKFVEKTRQVHWCSHCPKGSKLATTVATAIRAPRSRYLWGPSSYPMASTMATTRSLLWEPI